MEFDSLHAPRFTRIVLTAVLAALPFGAANAQPASNDASDAVALRLAVERQVADRGIGDLEQVFSFTGAMPTGVAVDPHSRRIFVNFPRWGDDVPYTVGEIVGDKVVPYPDAQTNRAATDSPARHFISVQSVVADGRGKLWVLDPAAPGFEAPVPGGAKLIAIDLKTNRVARTYVLPPDVALPTTYLNDVRFDFRAGKGGFAYITDSSTNGPGGIIVVDLATGAAWRRLSGHPSVQPDPSFVPVVEGEQLMIRMPGKPPAPFRVAADSLALSADGSTLYYAALTSRHLYAAPTALLRDRAVDEGKLGAAVVDLGDKGASDGLETDDRGRIYATDYEHNAIRRLDNGRWTTIAHDSRMLWPDSMSVAPGYLYFTANQIERQPLFHEGRDGRVKPYALFRVKIDAGPVAR
ncbi:gluconolaconase [Burkholderia pseudomallei]|nr:gluconolaconase [Burkholderia pseudomallei]MBO7775482.1 gluconolaconase [Burkholderia pseudomallei]MBO7804314.1 gluconolaconase [Burkholderia pseudomallei]MBO7908274.1 gluconolaconase [Burkholderia pseudomallei]MBO7931997.1 gluconolaconase [Burkholderia pseudomallei]